MSTDHPEENSSGHDASEEFRRKNPETFARYLSRRKTVFAVAYVGYVCAYLVRNNFKLTSEELRLANDWSSPTYNKDLRLFLISSPKY